MGFTSSEIQRLTFKVQAGNVIDANAGSYWYESRFPFNPAVDANRILSEYDTIQQYPAANLATARNNVSTYLSDIVDDLSQDVSSIRLTQAVSGVNNTWAAYNTYNDRSSEIIDLWIQPQKIPQTNGSPSNGYAIQLYSGDPGSGGEYISPTAGQSGGEVGWVFNYDMGLLFLSNDMITFINNNYSAGLDLYVKGFRYIGETGLGGDNVTPGFGIEISDLTNGDAEISILLDPSQDNLFFNSAGELSFDPTGLQNQSTIYNSVSRYLRNSYSDNGNIGHELFLLSSSSVYTNLNWNRSGTSLVITKNSHGLSIGDFVIIRNANEDNIQTEITAVTTNTFTVNVNDTGFTSGINASYSIGINATVDKTTVANNGPGSIILSAPSTSDVQLLGLVFGDTSLFNDPTYYPQTDYELTVPQSLIRGTGLNTTSTNSYIPLWSLHNSTQSSGGYEIEKFYDDPLTNAIPYGKSYLTINENSGTTYNKYLFGRNVALTKQIWRLNFS